MIRRRSHPLAVLSVLPALGACQWKEPAPAANEPVLMELSLVEDVPSAESQEAVLNGERLNLAPTPVISDDDIQAVGVAVEPDRLILSIELTEKGREQLRRVTAENIGRRMAFVLDGQVRSAPVIRDSIADGQVQIPVSGPEADRLAVMIRSRWQEPLGGLDP